MNAGSYHQRVALRRAGPLLLPLLPLGLLVWAGCVDRSTPLEGSLRALLTLEAGFSAELAQNNSPIDEWKVKVIRPGEGVIVEIGDAVDPGQSTVQVPQIEVRLKSECEGLTIRIELLASGTLWWVVEREHQVCTTSEDNRVDIPAVDFQWVGPAQMEVDQDTLRFALGQGEEASLEFVIQSQADSEVSWSVQYQEQDSWLDYEPKSGLIAPNGRQAVTVSVDATGLPTGQYFGNLWVEGFPGPNHLLFVELAVLEAPRIELSPSLLTFEKGTQPPAQAFSVRNSGQFGTLEWSASTDQDWLSISTHSGSLSAGESQQVLVQIESADLGAGEYTGIVAVEAPGASNTPEELPVFLTVNEVLGSAINGTVSAEGSGLGGVTVTLSGAETGET